MEKYKYLGIVIDYKTIPIEYRNAKAYKKYEVGGMRSNHKNYPIYITNSSTVRRNADKGVLLLFTPSSNGLPIFISNVPSGRDLLKKYYKERRFANPNQARATLLNIYLRSNDFRERLKTKKVDHLFFGTYKKINKRAWGLGIYKTYDKKWTYKIVNQKDLE